MVITKPEKEPPVKKKSWWRKYEEVLSTWIAAAVLITCLTFSTYLIIKYLF